ncbi:hypothetical protein BCR39DRAFT_595232 [Naematelia encephala]|uniref:Uncharacterized protein n=1 Tax=Naematelia encephala TaxID=71784 RepID=A0A1Y2AQC9_9TREE|nr:hypothetical protein BCR39DRAFT_595232 [Naematelia encephala]
MVSLRISDNAVRITHSVLFGITLLISIIALGFSGSLVGHYNSDGYPKEHTGAYRDRIRILLVASVWTTAFAIILVIGFQLLGRHRAFGLLSHLVTITIGFILFLVGSASLTALTDKISCGVKSQGFSRCNIVKGLVVISWIDTIFLLLCLIFLIVLTLADRGAYGVHRRTLYVE